MVQIMTGFVTSIVDMSAYPRAHMQVSIQLMEENGSIYSVVMNAIMLALLNTGKHLHNIMSCKAYLVGIKLNTMSIAVGCSVSKDGQVSMDPTVDMEQVTLYFE